MTCDHDSCLFASLRSLRNGLELGARIRAAHCLVMILLYKRNQPLAANIKFLVNATREHAVNLGIFAALFKSTRCILMNTFNMHKGRASFLAGLIVGYLVWGRRKSAINYQIVLYLLSRNLTGLINQQVEAGNIPNLDAYPAFAALTWAVVMGLHSVSGNSLQDGLRSSMDFLYNDDDHWKGRGFRQVLDFIPFSGK
jgi:peroxisomal membrane protein 4